MPRKLLTPATLAQRPPAKGRVEVRDTLSPLILRITAIRRRIAAEGQQITAGGQRSFIVRARIKGQNQPIRLTYDANAHISVLEKAREWAAQAVRQCRQGVDPRKLKADAEAAEEARGEVAERNRFGVVADRFVKMHAANNRTARESERIIDIYLRPGWDHRQICDIGRADIVALLDKVESKTFKGAKGKLLGGPVQADRVLAQLRKLMNWHATRDADFHTPIVPGMARTKPKERARTRVLSDAEIRLIWPHPNGTYGNALKTLFYTAQRVGEVAQMRRSQIGADGVWAIPTEAYKSKRPQFVPLTTEAQALVTSQPQIDGADLVFGAERDPNKEITIWSVYKAALDAKIAEANDGTALPRWVIHDIRRTCRTLMSRAGVRPDIAERVLGHAIPGVEGVYDRHAYVDEKRRALEALAAQLNLILNPPKENVVRLARGAAE